MQLNRERLLAEFLSATNDLPDDAAKGIDAVCDSIEGDSILLTTSQLVTLHDTLVRRYNRTVKRPVKAHRRGELSSRAMELSEWKRTVDTLHAEIMRRRDEHAARSEGVQ